jgi:hypothetical protein
VARAILLILAVVSFGTAAYAYFMAVRRTSDPDNAERIVTWGASARREAWSADTLRYRRIMRVGSGVGLLLFLAWEWLGLGR